MMNEDRFDATDPRTYFGHLAGVYDTHRPTYPEGAIDLILDGLRGSVQVADIGSGTGISTRLLAARGVEVLGIEPNDAMRDLAQHRSAGLAQPPSFRAGTGEATGLAEASVDLVVCAQAFHWFRPAEALAECRRILRPRGRLALMWNVRAAAATGFTGVYEQVVLMSQDDAEQRGMAVRRGRDGQDVVFQPWFTGARTTALTNPQVMDWPGVIGRARSASYFPPEGAAARTKLEGMLREAFDQDADGDGRVTLEQQTTITLADRA